MIHINQNSGFQGFNVSPRSDKIMYIVVHYVGAEGTAKNNADYFNGGDRQASADFFVGHSGEIWQYNPDPEKQYTWHCGGGRQTMNGGTFLGMCKNSNSIGIEMCCRHLGNDVWKFEKETVDACVELVKYLMKKYDVPEARVIRHYDVTGKHCPGVSGWIPPIGGEAEWLAFKKRIREEEELTSGPAVKYTEITGKAVATLEQMAAYITKVNPSVPDSVIEMIPDYIKEGKAEGIRGDIAFAQSCLETGNFTFKGSAVTLAQNNFCGMGVTQNGMHGNSFSRPVYGIRAQIQHLKAYANEEPLKQSRVDPRFQYVNRGCAPYVEWLGIQENPQGCGWAAGAGYGESILRILSAILAEGTACENCQVEEESQEGYQINLPDIKKGSRGTSVKLLQRLLKADGYTGLTGSVLAIDGDFGSNTDAAVREYQRKHAGLAVDGIVGPATWKSIIGL